MKPSARSCSYAVSTVLRETPRSRANARVGGNRLPWPKRPPASAVFSARVSCACKGPSPSSCRCMKASAPRAPGMAPFRPPRLALARANPRAPDETNPAPRRSAMHARPALRPHVALPSAAWAWVAVGGIGLGLADLAFAALYWFLHSGTPPIRIPQAIAGWVLGAHDARAGGIATALAGVALYCAIVSAMVAGYMRLASRWP